MKVADLSGEAKALVGIEAKTGVYPGMASFDRLKGVEGRRKRGRIWGRKGLESHCYHLMSRTCGGEIWFDDTEKEALARLIGKMSRFCGVEVLTYCVMGNHFHVLVRVPDKDQWMGRFDGAGGEEALLTHLGRFYSRSFMESLRWRLDEDRRLGDEVAAQGRLQGFKERLCDVSAFMKELKTRFTKWYNKRRGRRGTLWMERFKSVLVEGSRRQASSDKNELDALRTMALYLDLNPVRAGLVKDPAAYRWCGYAGALAGDKALREGLTQVAGHRSWVGAKAAYGAWVEEIAEAGSQAETDTQSKTEAKAKEGRAGALASAGASRGRGEGQSRLGLGELLRRRVRYFSDGGVIGSREFVREHRQRGEQDERRVPVIRELRVEDRLHCLRQLRINTVTLNRNASVL
jgi:putative transposase